MTNRVAGVAWLVTAVYYFYQYVLRSAPSVMMPTISSEFQLDAAGGAALVGIFYYGYSPFSLVAGVALDRWGPKTLVPLGAMVAGMGALLFGMGDATVAGAGRFMQGAGGVFALVGAVYIVTSSFPASRAATLVGATQMFGMAGGAAGQFAVGPLIGAGLAWTDFWIAMGFGGLVLAAALFLLLPRHTPPAGANWIRGAAHGMATVFRNPQSILCGLIAGLLFLPTTIFDMVWGVRFLQEARDLDYGSAVIRSATVPLGWIVGCPLLGFISDRIGQRRPVIIGGALVLLACVAWILYGNPSVFPPYVLGFTAGIASGAAMIPYTVIKEANHPKYGGTATGVVNFLNFTFSALLGPVFARIFQRTSMSPSSLEHYQTTFESLLYGIALAIVLTFVLKETGPAAGALLPRTIEENA